jgi:hypothetical protein
MLRPTAQKVERPGLASEPFADHRNNIVDFPPVDGSSKALATLKAQLALAGHQVHEGSNDDFIVTRWGMSKHCPDIGALRRFARVLGVSS